MVKDPPVQTQPPKNSDGDAVSFNFPPIDLTSHCVVDEPDYSSIIESNNDNKDSYNNFY